MKSEANVPLMSDHKLITIRDVARLAGVSPITASRALNKSHLVKRETRQKVEAAAAELKFIGNSAAGSLSNKRSKIVGIIVPTLSNSIFADTIQSITSRLMSEGFQALIGSNEYCLQREEDIIRTFISHRADALILTGNIHSKVTEELIEQYRIPTVEIWNISERGKHISVGMSNYQAAFEMTSFLISRGYEKIGYIGGPLENNDRSQDRMQGYRDALEKHDWSFDPALTRESPLEFASGGAAMQSLLSKSHSIDCVFASSDIIAFGALMECHRNEIKVPRDIALAGFDNTAIGAIFSPALTTISVPRQRIGLKAAEITLKLIRGETDINRRNDLGFDLKIRETT